MVGEIGDHTSVLMQQIQFVNAQVEQLGVWNARLKVCSEFAKESTNGTLYQTYFVSDAHKGSSQCLLLNVDNQAIGHEMAFIHAWERLEECAAASTTAIAMSLNGDPYTLAPDRQVHEELWLNFMAVEMWVMAMGTTRGRRKTLRLDMEVMFVFVYRQNANACQSENIQEPLSPQIVLHKKFSVVTVVPVTRERRLQRADSTHFRDVDLLFWSVKTGTIPRGIAISQEEAQKNRWPQSSGGIGATGVEGISVECEDTRRYPRRERADIIFGDDGHDQSRHAGQSRRV